MTDGQLRYKAYSFLISNIYYYSTSNIQTRTPYLINNSILTIFKDASLNLTSSNVDNFINAFLNFIGTYYPEYSSSISTTFKSIFDDSNRLSAFNLAFQNLGLTLQLNDTILEVVMPNATKKSIGSINSYGIILWPRKEINYAKKIKLMYSFESDKDISEVKYWCGVNNGRNSWLDTDSSNRLTLNGSGETWAVNTILSKNDLIYDYTNSTQKTDTIIINKNINKLLANSLVCGDEGSIVGSSAIKTFVFMHDNNDPLTIENGAFMAPKSAATPKLTYNIYTDSDVVKNYAFSSNVDVIFHPLSEWGD